MLNKELELHRIMYVKILKIHRTICVAKNATMFESKGRPKKCKVCKEVLE